jgi:hypothetical protein
MFLPKVKKKTNFFYLDIYKGASRSGEKRGWDHPEKAD